MDYNEDEILIGADYQAVVPDGLSTYGDALPYENEDKLLWTPGALSPNQVEDFLWRASSGPAVGEGCRQQPPPDDERCLYVLLQAGHDPDEALRRLPLDSHPFPSLPLLSPEETTRFEEGLASFGKDFRLVQLVHVRTRSIGELVHFYYLWKKSERFDVFTHRDKLVDCKRKKNDSNKNYRRKDKIPLNPNVTDYMSEFIDQDLKHITDSTVKLSLINGESGEEKTLQVKEEPLIKQERIDD